MNKKIRKGIMKMSQLRNTFSNARSDPIEKHTISEKSKLFLY